MGIQGRMASQRERMLGMTDAERAWRAQWVKDQVLHGEPVVPKDYYNERYNVIRRFYRAPLDAFERQLNKYFTPLQSSVTRHCIAKMGFFLLAVYSTHYYFKYNKGDWTHKGGWKVTLSRPALYPGDKDFPNYKETPVEEYASYGFKNSPI